MGESETMLAQTGNESSLYTTNVNKQESLTHMEQIADFNASINAENVKDAENGITSDTVHDASALSAEEERLWSIVQTNSIDFNAWTALIEETEKILDVGNILKIRKVYDAFLAEFPLCYGYWKKYADHESHLGSIEKVVEVYERAVIGVTYSVDMWLHYCVFAINTYGDPETVRRLFERGLAYVGTDYQSFSLWDKYIEYEYTLQDWPRVALLYTRVLEIPNQQLDRYFEGFKELVARKPLSELWTAEEASAAANSESVGKETEEEGNNGNDVNSSLKDAEDLEKYIAIREELYKKTKDLDFKINGFETAIRRPYFHVRPLNVTELENWHNYLDFVEKGDEFDKVVKVYERCLIACANYPEYWKRYVLCMEANKNMDLANNALARATQVFVKRQPEIHLFAARFKHQHGDITGARAAYELVHAEISPGLLEAIIKHANMENRLGNLEDACNLYEQSIAIEKGKEHSQTLPLLYAQYSRFLYLVTGKVEKAREILDEAVKNIQLSKPLLEGLIHLESIQSLVPKRVEYLNSLVEKFTVPSYDHNLHVASIADREELSSIFLQFLDVFGDAEYIKKSEKRHAKLFLRHTSAPLESKKRVAEDDLMSEKSKLAKWTATGYGIDPQTQEWNAGYAAQQAAAYSGAYTGYATHPHPETYQTQVVVTQQSYAPVASLTSATVAPSAYYPTTYY